MRIYIRYNKAKGWAFSSLVETLIRHIPGLELAEDRDDCDAELALTVLNPGLEQGFCPAFSVVRISGMRWLDGAKPSMEVFKEVISRCRAVIAPNRRLMGVASSLNSCSFLIPNGLDVDRWTPRPFTAGFCGNISSPEYREYKGYDLYVSACEAEGCRRLEALYGDAQIGHDRMMEDFYWRVDCLVHPTLGEGCSNTLMEACACGVPIITTRQAGFHGEEMRDGENVLFCERTKESIASCLRRLMEDRALAERLSAGARAFALKNHDGRRFAVQVGAILDMCASENRRRSGRIAYKRYGRAGKGLPCIGVVIASPHKGWAHERSVHEIASRLKDRYVFKLCDGAGGFDLLWCRSGAAPAHLVSSPFVWTCGTGGAFFAPYYSSCMDSQRAVMDRCRGLIVQSAEGVRIASMRSPVPVYMCPNGVDIAAFRPPASGRSSVGRPFTVGFAGRKDNGGHKGWELVREACGQFGFELKSCSYDPAERVAWDAMPEFYRSIDVLAQPSDAEGCSNSIMEAMSSGLPCLICRESGYHGESCLDGFRYEDGNVFFVERDADKIGLALTLLRDDDALYSRISRNARAFAEEHSWDLVAERMAAIFNAAIGYGRKGADVPESMISIPDPWVTAEARDGLMYRGRWHTAGERFRLLRADMPDLGSKIRMVKVLNEEGEMK